MAASPNSNERISWPKRAVVTAGMPYGNKPLHFGHIAGVFVPADAFARFLRDRIGAANVRFISGTDCFGSPINEGYRKLVEAGEFDGTIAEYVERNHEAQKNTLDAYGISLSIYEGSGMGHSGDVHQLITEKFIEKLHEKGTCSAEARCSSTMRKRARSSTAARWSGAAPCRAASPSTPTPTSATWGTATPPRTSSRRSRR